MVNTEIIFFTKQIFKEFLRDLSSGRGRTSPIKGAKLPILKPVDLWDGEDAKLQEMEVDEAPEVDDEETIVVELDMNNVILEPKIKIDL